MRRRNSILSPDGNAVMLAHRILNSVIQAIEINDPSRDLRNNLVAWQAKGFSPKSRFHLVLLKAVKSSATRRELEGLLFDFYQNHISDDEAFEQFGRMGVTCYDPVNYLASIREPHS